MEGDASPNHAGPADEAQPSRFHIPIGVALAAMVVALILAALILSRVAGPLHGLVFPPSVPVPKGVQEVDHVHEKNGDEYWIYRTSLSGDDVAAFYDERGDCRYSPRPDEAPDAPAPVGSYSVALCTGQNRRGNSGIGWQVYINTGYSDEEGPTIFRLYRYQDVK